MKHWKCASLFFLLLPTPVLAQQVTRLCVQGSSGNCVPVDGTAPLPVSASVSVSGFTPNGNYASPLSVSNSTANVALPTGAVVLVSNPGSTAAYVNLGTSNAVTATTSDILIPAGANVGLTVGSNTYLAAITASSTTTLNLSGGTGIVAGYGGSSSGGGSSGAVYGPTAVGSAAANPPVLAGGTADGTATGNVGVLKIVSGVASVTATALPLPTGASTSALQPTNAAQGSSTSGQTGPLVQGAVTTSAPSYTTAQTSPLSLDTAGNLRVNVVTGGAGGGAVYGPTAVGSAAANPPVLIAGTANAAATGNVQVAKVDSSGNLQVAVTSAAGVAQGSSTSGQTVSPIGCRTLTSAPTDTTAQTNIPWCTTSGSLVVAQPTAANLNATVVGTGTFAVQAAQATAASLNATVVGTGTFATQSTPTTAATGGATPYTLTAANSTNATNIKASAGTLYHVAVYNNGVSTAPLAWVSFYNTAGTPSCGTSIVYQTQIPVNSTNGAGAVEDFADGLAFSTGIGICVTTGIAGTGSVAASTYVVNLGFK